MPPGICVASPFTYTFPPVADLLCTPGPGCRRTDRMPIPADQRSRGFVSILPSFVRPLCRETGGRCGWVVHLVLYFLSEPGAEIGESQTVCSVFFFFFFRRLHHHLPLGPHLISPTFFLPDSLQRLRDGYYSQWVSFSKRRNPTWSATPLVAWFRVAPWSFLSFQTYLLPFPSTSYTISQNIFIYDITVSAFMVCIHICLQLHRNCILWQTSLFLCHTQIHTQTLDSNHQIWAIISTESINKIATCK